MVRCRYLKGGDACIFFLYPAGIQERRRICMKWINVAKITKWILDFMFYAGIAACFTLPFSLRFIGKFFPHYEIFYVPMLILFFIPPDSSPTVRFIIGFTPNKAAAPVSKSSFMAFLFYF